jgi:hypothetical protein
MQVNSLQELVGSTVVKAEKIEDDLIVWFQNGAYLTVYNKFQITASEGRSGTDRDLATGQLTELTKDNASLRLAFSTGVKLTIDISEDGYSGPEALQLTRPGLPSIVWRIDD